MIRALMVLAVAAVLAPLAAPAAGDAAVMPFTAHYAAEWRSINVGVSDLQLKPDTESADLLYTWTMTARGVFRLVYSHDVIQKSWISVAGEHARPMRYRAEDGDATVSIDFDWDGGHARGEVENKPVNLKLNEGVQDIMSIQIEVMLDLKNGNLPKTFRIVDKDEIKDFNYTFEGPARIRTALGELDTLVVSSQRTGNNRLLKMWFAPSLGFVPVQAERSRDGKLEFAMRIKTLKP